jgi:predicted heme/steroid binding protein/uncharacterized membrane protein
MKEFDPDELSQCDGKDGKPVYIVHRGRVIDVGGSKLWKGGVHMKRHHAGEDITADLQAAPHGPDVLDRYPQVGVLKKEEIPEIKIPEALSWLLAKFPMLRRHPHPMTVHFPIVFMFSTPVFNIIYLITGVKVFELTALHCLAGGILFTVVAIMTGFYTWWLNYMAKPLRAVTIKRRLAITMLATEIVVFVWRIKVPDILDSFGTASLIYFLLVLSFLPMVTAMGWYGAQLTFPIERESKE